MVKSPTTRHFVVVIPTVTDLGHEETRYIWDYGTFTLIAYFSRDGLTEVFIRDSKDRREYLAHFWTQDKGAYTDNECAYLISGIKELVESALLNIRCRRRLEVERLDATLKLLGAE